MSEKRKIALFISAIGYGGAEKVVSLLLYELPKYYDVTLILLYNEIKLPIPEDTKLVILSKPDETFKTSIFGRIKDNIKFIFTYQKVLKEEKIDVVVSFLVRQNIMTSIAKMFNPKLKTIISERCFPSIMYKDDKLTAFLTKLLIPYFYNKNDKLFSNSIYINADLKTNYRLKIDRSVIYNPILTKTVKPELATYSDFEDIFKVVTVGRMIPVKNQKSIIEAISMLSSNFYMEIYGDGYLHQQLDELSIKLNLAGRVHFNGNVDDVKSYIVKGHCFVLCSLTEGFPNVVLEAMSVGLPVICTNCMSGPLELLNNNEDISILKGSFAKAKYGILVNVDDAVGLSQAIKYLQKNPEARQKYSDLSFERAKTYDIKNIGIHVKNLIDSI
ncbi:MULTISPECIES: glycosyltransferase [Bizionia]|uniref:Glycosyltransferase n=1 Tax=Bizionia algoritergicola TaxID=291187 RepID=A0A5D0QWP4_9FLAO|nr:MULTISPECIES: glycosyltransferase [Bizionia]OBX24143.1 glycosyl transferase [Bizionia sp. APA-3]TYB73653.1 glycosyltransferase [Bizionia algoritergicola]